MPSFHLQFHHYISFVRFNGFHTNHELFSNFLIRRTALQLTSEPLFLDQKGDDRYPYPPVKHFFNLLQLIASSPKGEDTHCPSLPNHIASNELLITDTLKIHPDAPA